MAALPLLARIADDDTRLAYLTPVEAGLQVGRTHRDAAAGKLGLLRPPVDAPTSRMPTRALEPGEQYRFHFDMRKCIACKCCVVACNEQNGNPALINWRRVTEIEAGHFPTATRAFLSMGCNHCLEPTCLAGCPVDAYSKDPVTGIVRHSADACIGCQYCTWNCSYGVPQYNAERGVVGKCDMCHGRLSMGQAPACVSAVAHDARDRILGVGINRTALQAGRLEAVIAAHGEIRAARRRKPSALDFTNAAPIDLCGIAVLLVAGDDAALAADAQPHVHVEAVLLAGAGRTIGHAFAFAASPRRRNKLLPAGLDPLEQRQLGRCSVDAAATQHRRSDGY